MAAQAVTSPTPLNPQQIICNAFVQQYYHLLHETPDQAHKFYQDGSNLGWANAQGVMEYVTTLPEISRKIMSMDFKNYLTEIETADALPSHNGGVLIVVTGSLTMSAEDRRRFTQTFFLAPQECGGYFVLSDILRLISETTSDEVNQENEGIQNAGSVAKSEPTPVDVVDITDHKIVKDNVEDGEVLNPTVDGTAVNNPTVDDSTVKNNTTANCATVKNIPTVNGTTVKNNPTVSATTVKSNLTVNAASVESNATAESPVKLTKKVVPQKTPVAVSSSPAQKDVTKQSYASIVKVMKEGPPTPVVKAKQAPKPVTKAVDGPEKSSVKPLQAGENTPSDKNVTKNNSSHDEQGYSVYVKNLPYNATVKMVEEEFKKFGVIKPGGIQVRNKTDGFCFGFVEFESQQSMQAAIEASPIILGEKQVLIEEKRTTTRVVNGLVVMNTAGGGGRFQSARGPYRGDNARGRGYVNNANYRGPDNFNRMSDGENFDNRNDGENFNHRNNVDNFNHRNNVDNFNHRNNGDNFHNRNNGDNFNHRNGGDNFSRRNEFRNRNEYSGRGRGPPHGNDYHHNGNGFHQLRPFQNENARFARVKIPKQTPVAA